MNEDKLTEFESKVIEVLSNREYLTRREQAIALGISRQFLWRILREDPGLERKAAQIIDEENTAYLTMAPDRLRKQLRYMKRVEKEKVDFSGYVYLAQTETALNGKNIIATKIGHTKDPQNRFNSKTDNPNEIKYILLAKVDDMLLVEKYLQAHFKDKNLEILKKKSNRRSSEWYLLNDDELDFAREEIIINSLEPALVDKLRNGYWLRYINK